jgi:hypothetical protein
MYARQKNSKRASKRLLLNILLKTRFQVNGCYSRDRQEILPPLQQSAGSRLTTSSCRYWLLTVCFVVVFLSDLGLLGTMGRIELTHSKAMIQPSPRPGANVPLSNVIDQSRAADVCGAAVANTPNAAMQPTTLRIVGNIKPRNQRRPP